MIKANFSLQNFRDQLASYEAMPQLVALGFICGIGCGLLIALFRFAIDTPLSLILTGHVENFESLSLEQRFLFPSIGGLVLSLMYTYWPLIKNKVGIVHLLERLVYHQGYISGKNLLAQFLVAVVALVSGQSVGREGPAIYMGASLSSMLGQALHIPHNAQRILLACGAAAAISAAFNTPLAGVIFAMEVILIEYTVAGFTPVIVAAVTSSLITRLIFSSAPLFDVPAFGILSYSEIPWIMLLGIIIGLLATLFIKLMIFTSQKISWPLQHKLILAGLLTGIVAIAYPQVMGTGYDTIEDTFLGKLDANALLGILIAKVLLTPIILGLGMPAGLIGPSLFIGAVCGALLGIYGSFFYPTLFYNTFFIPTSVSHIGLYAMLGMGAMMAAVLNAPLAALIALLELTYNPHIIFPAMIAIVVANFTSRYICITPSAFLASLQAQGLDYRLGPLEQILTRASVAKAMSRNFQFSYAKITYNQAKRMIVQNRMWFIIKDDDLPIFIFPATNLENFMQCNLVEKDGIVDLNRIPAERYKIIKVNLKVTLYDALQLMNQNQADLLCVYNHSDHLIGLLSRGQIKNYYDDKQYV
jgi:CIC family chloride channel protein